MCFINLRSIVSCQIPQLLNPYLESLLQVMQWMQIPLLFRILRSQGFFNQRISYNMVQMLDKMSCMLEECCGTTMDIRN